VIVRGKDFSRHKVFLETHLSYHRVRLQRVSEVAVLPRHLVAVLFHDPFHDLSPVLPQVVLFLDPRKLYLGQANCYRSFHSFCRQPSTVEDGMDYYHPSLETSVEDDVDYYHPCSSTFCQ
jgi:hypothetical protein